MNKSTYIKNATEYLNTLDMISNLCKRLKDNNTFTEQQYTSIKLGFRPAKKSTPDLTPLKNAWNTAVKSALISPAETQTFDAQIKMAEDILTAQCNACVAGLD